MSSSNAFPEITITGTGISQNLNGIEQTIKMCVIAPKGFAGFTGKTLKAIFLEEHTALIAEKDEEIERLRNFIVKVRRSSTCPATVLVAGQVLDGHNVAKEALAGGKDV